MIKKKKTHSSDKHKITNKQKKKTPISTNMSTAPFGSQIKNGTNNIKHHT